jgi:hypothetical protein
MTKKLIIAMAIAIAISFCVFQSTNAQVTSSDKGIELKPGMTLTDPGKNAVFQVTAIDSANNIIDLGIRIDGSNWVALSGPLSEFQRFYEAAKLVPTTVTPLQKVSKPKSLRAPIRVGDTWKSKDADADITILSQDGDNLQLYIRIDGSNFAAKTSTKALNTALSNPPNKFQLAGQKTTK